MTLKKIQFEQVGGTVLEVKKESTGFVPFRVTAIGAYTADLDVAGDLDVVGTTVVNSLQVAGISAFYDAATFTEPVTFTNTVTFTTSPTGLVPSSRSIFTSGGLTGGGDLTTNRTLQIASSGVTTTKINDAAVTEVKIADAAVTDAKLAEKRVKLTGATQLVQKVVSFAWNMDTTASITVAHGLTLSKIRSVNGTFTNGSTTFPLIYSLLGQWETEIGSIGSTTVGLSRRTGGFFDSAIYNAVTGYLVIMHEE